jgi:RNA polymerase sigma-70 factor (ECF subfamily)
VNTAIMTTALTNDHCYIEKELLRKVAAGDELAFGQLFHTWRNKLYFFILRIIDSPSLTEDLVQDIFVKIWVNRETLSTIANIGAYLYTIARNEAITGMRRKARETIILAELRMVTTAAGLPVDEALLHKQVQEKLQSIINQLPPQQKLVYTLTREQGLRQEEVASQLHISVSTVQNHMTQALRTIRCQLRLFYPPRPIYLLIIEIMLLHV